MLTVRENAMLAYQHKQPEWIPVFGMDIACIMAHPEIERWNGFGTGKDYFGIDWEYVPDVKAPMTIAGHEVLEDITEWKEKVHFPDLEAIDWEKSAERDTHMNAMAFQAGAQVVPMYPDGSSVYDHDQLILCMVINGPFERLHALMGFENSLAALLEEPEACYDFFGAMADYKIKYFEKIHQYYKVDIINAHDDFGANDRMFMSLDTWRKLLKPHLARTVEAVHDMGLLYQHHSCGYVEPLIDDLVEIGVDALDPLQAGNKAVPEMKKRLNNKLTFLGGFDNQGCFDIPNPKKEDVIKEYHRVIDSLAPGGSYVEFFSSFNMDVMQWIVEEHMKYGKDFYKR